MPRPKRADEAAPRNLVGARVRIARMALKPALDQADLAASLSEALEIPFGRTTIVRLEAGKRPVSDVELVALAKILCVDVKWLLFGKEN